MMLLLPTFKYEKYNISIHCCCRQFDFIIQKDICQLYVNLKISNTKNTMKKVIDNAS